MHPRLQESLCDAGYSDKYLDNRELWLQLEEAYNIMQSCKKFVQTHSSRLAAELLDDASTLLRKHIQEVIAALCTSSTPIGRPSSLQLYCFNFVLLQQA